ncbi:hypothetical protein BDV96DRAFT_607621 [Lophiotrema nucula]|uniref:Uncharacterized protein n=1 Tax=Lophiotrema nucula TaxID=690887 RepID=A0A6A5YG97_9PLEO|nr:hypothetical protein BDV96DRAFT_607621 [Lophiotrema nucula]
MANISGKVTIVIKTSPETSVSGVYPTGLHIAANQHGYPWCEISGDNNLRVPGACELEAVKHLVAYINGVGRAVKEKQDVPRFDGYGDFGWDVKLYVTALLIPMDEQRVLKPLRSSLIEMFKEWELGKAELKTLDYAFSVLPKFYDVEKDEFFKLVTSTYAYQLKNGLLADCRMYEKKSEGCNALNKAVEEAGQTRNGYALRSSVLLRKESSKKDSPTGVWERRKTKTSTTEPHQKMEGPMSVAGMPMKSHPKNPYTDLNAVLQRSFGNERAVKERPSVAGGKLRKD